MGELATFMQIVAWALWFEKKLAGADCVGDDCPEPTDPDDEDGRYHDHFDVRGQIEWLVANAHLPPAPQQCCDCGTYISLCAWRPADGEPNGYTHTMKHYYPERRLEGFAAMGHPLLQWISTDEVRASALSVRYG